MKKTRSLLLAVAIAATAFTLSCGEVEGGENGESSSSVGGGGNPSSSSVGGGGGMDLSDLPPQNLIFDGQLEGKIDVFLRIWRDDGEYTTNHGDKYDRLSAGKIENGKLSLSLPTNVNSKYLDRTWDCYDSDSDCQLSVAPQSLAYAYGTLIVPTLGDDCSIRPYLIKSGERVGSAQPNYNSASGTVTGTRSEEILNLNLSQGWQLIYYYFGEDICYEYEDDDGLHQGHCEYWVTDLPAGTALEWRIRSDD